MSQNGAIQSLQKFRFTKRAPGEPDQSDSNSGPEVKKADRDDPDFVQSGSSSTSSSDLDASEPSVSPVFNKKFGCLKPVKSSSQSSSPWLSKASGISQSAKTNGVSKSKCKTKPKTKYRRVRTYSSSDSETETSSVQLSQSSSQASAAKGKSGVKNGQWSRQLTDMFPTATPLQIRAAIAAATRADSIEAGVDYLVRGHSKGKRKHGTENDENGQLPKSKSGSYKRIRTMSGDSDDSHPSLPSTPLSSCSLSNSQTTEKLSTSGSQQHKKEIAPLSSSEETSLKFLQGAFPTLPRKRLIQVLRDCGGSSDQAVIVLSSDVQEQETESQAASSSVQATRASKSKNVKHEVLSVSDGDDDYEEEGEDSDDSLDGEQNFKKRKSVLSFLEEASLPELQLLPGCSRKKAEALFDLRPFGTWEKLVSATLSLSNK